MDEHRSRETRDLGGPISGGSGHNLKAPKIPEFAVEAVDYCLVLLFGRHRDWPTSEAENQGKGIVYRSQLTGIQAPRRAPKSLWIYHRGLLDEDSGFDPVE